MAKKPLMVGGFMFLLVALVHLSRIVFGYEVVVNGKMVPLWANGLGFAIAGWLSYWQLKTAIKN